MNKIKIILIIAFTIFITGCSGASPRVGAGMGMGVGIGFSGKKPVVRPYIHGGIGAGLFKFF
ncbi:MAG: hypothetical protein KHZ27_08870 [Fusobacterium sp.]|uniref:hypothetical protein n=1 Tax=Fusobacterium sp. SB021 TaxID=2744227 RepID=UPI001DEDE475|nr:hypothetical protein [Fusobacterium sp.]